LGDVRSLDLALLGLEAGLGDLDLGPGLLHFRLVRSAIQLEEGIPLPHLLPGLTMHADEDAADPGSDRDGHHGVDRPRGLLVIPDLAPDRPARLHAELSRSWRRFLLQTLRFLRAIRLLRITRPRR